ncbi:hypothetical protein BJ875DRAFT_457186 [Amylocarpus encephaloides]|uniref:Uncharacterized protein n=1 Tax=Amylocarpus encephaloides TaxID=45428 RepID=A0A9P7YMH1_9HELO|nr:hypothetical protein BJ875DRAFT_457186 [Amylocarpus encephaloides]
MIRNPHTFALGVILIELAYQAPLDDLRKLFKNVESDDLGLDSEFYLADTISSAMTSQLGKGYKEVVYKCINCDFGAGFDLLSEALQDGFYKEVICVLDGIEKHLRFTKT